MNFLFFGKVVEIQKLSFFPLGLLPVSPHSFFCYFLSPLLLFMAVILLEFKQLVVWSKVCGFSGLIVMAASELEESHRAVGKPLLFSPSLCGSPI